MQALNHGFLVCSSPISRKERTCLMHFFRKHFVERSVLKNAGTLCGAFLLRFYTSYGRYMRPLLEASDFVFDIDYHFGCRVRDYKPPYNLAV